VVADQALEHGPREAKAVQMSSSDATGYVQLAHFAGSAPVRRLKAAEADALAAFEGVIHGAQIRVCRDPPARRDEWARNRLPRPIRPRAVT
jgi:hypothetical protein